jgi:hypothetical protein
MLFGLIWHFKRLTNRMRFYYLLYAAFLLRLYFGPENGSKILLSKVDWLSTDYMALQSRRYNLQSENNIVTYPWFAWLIRRVFYLLIGFIGRLYNWLQQFTNHYLTHCHLLPTGHSTGTVLTSDWTAPLFHCTSLYSLHSLSVLLTVSTYNSSSRTPRKTPSSFVKNSCFLVRYLATDILPLLRAYASVMCFPSHCPVTGICVTILCNPFLRVHITSLLVLTLYTVSRLTRLKSKLLFRLRSLSPYLPSYVILQLDRSLTEERTVCTRPELLRLVSCYTLTSKYSIPEWPEM